jgi:hypothetical protein
MPFLNSLRRQGADLTARVGLPSLSMPGRGVMLSGAWQEVSGQTTNYEVRPLRVDHVFRAAKRAGRRTAMAAHQGSHTLVRGFVDAPLVYPDEPEGRRSFADLEAELMKMGEGTRELMAKAAPDLAFLEYTMTDDCGHQWGGASDEYRQAALLIDDQIRRLAETLDLRSTVLMVTADHGHTPRGGHGGPEAPVMQVPLVMCGGIIRPAFRAEVRQIDIAPTAATLLGAAFPASNQGRPLTALLDLSDEQQRQIHARLLQQREGFVARYRSWLAGAAVAPGPVDPEAPLARIEERLHALTREAQQAGEERRAAEQRQRAPLAALIALALPLLVGALLATGALPRAQLAPALLAALLGLLLYAALFGAFGLGYSFSTVNKDENVKPFFARDVLAGVLAAAGAAALAGGLLRRRSPGVDRVDLLAQGTLAVAVLAWPFLAKAALFHARFGAVLRWSLPDPAWGFGFYLDLLVLMGLGLGAPVLALAALAGAGVARPR